MNDDQARNRDAWDQIYRNEDYFPEGYAPAQGYDPVEARNGYSDNQGSTTKPYHQTQGVDEYSDSETSATSSYGSQQNASTADDNGIPEEEIREFVSSRRQKHEVKSRAKPKEGQPKSARAQRREKVASENNGEVSATDQPKGLVEWHEGVLFWFDPEDKEWVKANYHDQYRDQFIREDRAFEGDYLVTPESGKGANDVTSACSAFNQLEVSHLFLSIIPFFIIVC